MGIYNCANTLTEAVSSIQKQTYSDWELIMCDDGSTDNTLEVAYKLAAQDKRIHIIQNKNNLGLAATLNNCLEVAKGEYIARMDGDDICPEDRLICEFQFLEQHREYALVSGWMECFDNAGTYGLVKYKEKPEYSDFVRGSQFCHAGCMIRKSVLLQLKGYSTEEETTRVEDYDLWVRLYASGFKGYNLQKIMYNMRDDRNAYRRRKLKYRINESKISSRVFNDCELSVLQYRYVLYPVLKGLIPSHLYVIFHKKRVKYLNN